MNRFLNVFPEGKAFLPVIHVTHEEQAHRNAEVAFQHGADGIFLIGHYLNARTLDRIYESLREDFQEEWIGVNFLEFHTPTALSRKVRTMNAVWADDGLIELQHKDPAHAARELWCELERERQKSIPHDFMYFGGIAFRGQDFVVDQLRVASYAVPYMDALIACEPYAGKAVDPKKVEAIKTSIGNEKHLGLASGVTPKNILDYLDHVDVYLVNTGISDSFTELNPQKTEDCANVIHSSVKL